MPANVSRSSSTWSQCSSSSLTWKPIFLYPWAIIFKDLKMFGFWEMLVYIGIVLAGYWYIVKKGVIDWNRPSKADRI